MSLFDVFDKPKQDEGEDRTQITQVLLYFDEPDAVEFKALCKQGMIASGENLKEANISDFLLKTLRNLYANAKS